MFPAWGHDDYNYREYHCSCLLVDMCDISSSSVTDVEVSGGRTDASLALVGIAKQSDRVIEPIYTPPNSMYGSSPCLTRVPARGVLSPFHLRPSGAWAC